MKMTYARAKALSVQRVGQELLILDQGTGMIHQLNQTATLIWQRCDEGLSPQEMTQLLVADYEIEKDVASKDVIDTLERLRALNLVVVVE